MAKLVINPTSASKKEIPIASRVISIGRDPSNDLVLSDSMVSRRHAILEQRDDIYVLRDNNSSNGTLVNGDRVESEQTLRDGDLVAIGSSRLLFQLEERGAGPPENDAGISSSEPSSTEESFEADPALESQSLPPASGDDVTCPSCGRRALGSDRFCRACGAGLEKKLSATCTACGQTVPLPAEFCGHCGHELPSKHRGVISTEPKDAADLDLNVESGKLVASGKGAGANARGRPRPKKPREVKESLGEQEPAGFGVRLVAALVDAMILAFPVLMAVLLWLAPAGPRPVTQRSMMLIVVVFLLLAAAYHVLFWGARGATPGKSLLGLVVRDEDMSTPIGYGRAALRLVGYLASSLIVGLGFVMIAFSDDRRGLHDRIARTSVARTL